ncbi:MAG: hypothetical protein ACK40G_03050 [Cytophagaceae bacterium]
MKIKTNFLLLLFLLGTSCSTISFNEIIDNKKPVELIIIDSITAINRKNEMIEMNSIKGKRLIEFFNKHTNGWMPIHGSFHSEILLRQDDFTLKYNKRGKSVIINFKDKNGKINQVTKEISEGELDFIIE